MTFLIDTGADHSLLKENVIESTNVDNNQQINIHGIGQGVEHSIEMIVTEVQTGKFIIPHNFHVVNCKFPIPCAGILGIDFIKK